jgi:hypothetical protein
VLRTDSAIKHREDFSPDSVVKTQDADELEEDVKMFVPRKNRSRAAFAAILLFVVAMFMAPSAFARGHVGVSIGFSGPGYSIGYSDCRHCGGGYWGGSVYGGGYYAPGYASYAYPSYGPAYYNSYPAYYPSYGSSYYYSDRHYRPVNRRVVHRDVRYYDDRGRRDDYRRDSYRNDRSYSGRDGQYRRASYYDRRN